MSAPLASARASRGGSDFGTLWCDGEKQPKSGLCVTRGGLLDGRDRNAAITCKTVAALVRRDCSVFGGHSLDKKAPTSALGPRMSGWLP